MGWLFGRNRTRTYDRLCVRQELYQLSYTPTKRDKVNGLTTKKANSEFFPGAVEKGRGE
jgi:hypothetical protein